MDQAAAAAALAKEQGTISSRFVSQDAVDEAKERQAEEWKAAYARIGQEPPPQEPEEAYDGRTLYERLNSQKEAKREEWDVKMKLSNQYRGLESEELQFLAEKAKERRAAEKLVEQAENDEVREYREALAVRNAALIAASAPQPLASSSKPLPLSSAKASSSSSSSPSTTATATTTAKTNLSLPPTKKKPSVLQNLKKGLIIKSSKSKPAVGAAAHPKTGQNSTSAVVTTTKEIPKTLAVGISTESPIKDDTDSKDNGGPGSGNGDSSQRSKRPAEDGDAEDEKRRKV